jgi:hypothetical protein
LIHAKVVAMWRIGRVGGKATSALRVAIKDVEKG